MEPEKNNNYQKIKTHILFDFLFVEKKLNQKLFIFVF
jgi:hypothetical protein